MSEAGEAPAGPHHQGALMKECEMRLYPAVIGLVACAAFSSEAAFAHEQRAKQRPFHTPDPEGRL